MDNILTESQMEERIQKELAIRDSTREAIYQKKFEELKSELLTRTDSFLVESILANNSEKIQTEAELSVYKPIVNGILEVLKTNNIRGLLKESNEDASEYVELLKESVEKISELRTETERFKRMYNIYKTITNHLSGMDKTLIENAVAKFKDSELSETKLEEELTRYILSYKGDSKKIQLESIADDKTFSEIDNILNDEDFNFKPTSKIKVNGISKRKVLDEASGIPNVKEEDYDSDPAKAMVQEWSNFST